MNTVFQNLWNESGGGQDAFAACVYGRGGDSPGKLVFFGQYGQLRLNTVDLSCVNYDGTLPTPVPDKFIEKSNFEINSSIRTLHSQSPSSCAAVEAGIHLCLLWNDDRKGVCCTVGDPANAFATPRAWYIMRESNGTPLQNHVDHSYDLAAIAINESGLLLAAHYNGPNNHRIVYIGYFRLDDRVDAPRDIQRSRNMERGERVDDQIRAWWHSRRLRRPAIDTRSAWNGIATECLNPPRARRHHGSPSRFSIAT